MILEEESSLRSPDIMAVGSRSMSSGEAPAAALALVDVASEMSVLRGKL